MKGPSIYPETGRLWGVDWQPADEIGVASCSHRDQAGGRLKNTVLLRLVNGTTETGLNLSMSRARARQIAIALYEASGSRWPFGPPRPLPNRLLKETRAIIHRETGFAITLAASLRGALYFLEGELEQRQHGGNEEDWAELAEWVRCARGLVDDLGGAA